jgi:hypothetical protein
VIEAAVVVLIALPALGIEPISTCETAWHPMPAEKVNGRSVAAAPPRCARGAYAHCYAPD